MSEVSRRRWLRTVTGGALALKTHAASDYIVGLKYGSDPYATTIAAIAAAGQFPDVGGRTVAIKTNLVVGAPASTGITTDPEVVRAIADTALARGATAVLIAEAGGLADAAPPFSACGYDLFESYHPSVSLVDLGAQPLRLVSNPRAYIYQKMWLPEIAVQPNTVWISAAKMKTHALATVTLNVKNLFGLFLPSAYRYSEGAFLPRTDPHELGMDQSINEILMTRPIHYAVIDGVIGMEKNGPVAGSPIASNAVVAGSNLVAVDRVAGALMGAFQDRIVHLSLASWIGLGPWNLDSIEIAGDPPIPRPYEPAVALLPPTLWPTAYPAVMKTGQGGVIAYKIPSGYTHLARLEVIQANNETPGVTVRRILFDWKTVTTGSYTVTWNGLDGERSVTPPGRYLARLLTRYESAPATRIATNSASKAFWIT